MKQQTNAAQKQRSHRRRFWSDVARVAMTLTEVLLVVITKKGFPKLWKR